jgi:protein gp37
MGKNSEISWTHHTFNCWWGCIEVSPGCTGCYARTISHRFGRAVWGPAKTTPRMLMSAAYWKQPLKWNAEAERAGERKRVFCASMADVFEDHPQLPPERAKLWALIEQTPALDWLLLTKRPENLELMLPERWRPYTGAGLPRNIWFGFSAEDQKNFDARWPVVESFKRQWYPAIVFLSAEPLIGPLDIADALNESDIGDDYPLWTATLDWVITGGESGAGARVAQLAWFRSLRDQCVEAEVPFHFKQYGRYLPLSQMIPGVHCGEGEQLGAPNDRYLRLGKHAAGRILDGREWNEFPE